MNAHFLFSFCSNWKGHHHLPRSSHSQGWTRRGEPSPATLAALVLPLHFQGDVNHLHLPLLFLSLTGGKGGGGGLRSVEAVADMLPGSGNGSSSDFLLSALPGVSFTTVQYFKGASLNLLPGFPPRLCLNLTSQKLANEMTSLKTAHNFGEKKCSFLPQASRRLVSHCLLTQRLSEPS